MPHDLGIVYHHSPDSVRDHPALAVGFSTALAMGAGGANFPLTKLASEMKVASLGWKKVRTSGSNSNRCVCVCERANANSCGLDSHSFAHDLVAETLTVVQLQTERGQQC